MLARQSVPKNKGFSLIELIIAVSIIMISMLGLLTSMMHTSRTNSQNDLRNTSIRLTNQTAEALLAITWTKGSVCTSISDADLSQGNHTRTLGNTSQDSRGLPTPNQSIRNYQQSFDIRWQITCRSASLMEIMITITPAGSGVSNSAVIYKHSTI